MTSALDIGWPRLAFAAALLLLNGGLSLLLGLRLERKLMLAALRTAVQLTILGYLLVPIFRVAHPGLVLGVASLMVALAAREAIARSERGYAGAVASTFVALLLGAAPAVWVGTALVIEVEPWWHARYLIPLVGMVLGNALTGVSLGIDRCLNELDEGRGRVESLLSCGATRWEAARPVAVEALRSAMIPILNAMSVVGLVTITGMMTGQLMGGTPPTLAARYQIMVMFLIAGATALGAGFSVLLCLHRLFDAEHRLRVERMSKRE